MVHVEQLRVGEQVAAGGADLGQHRSAGMSRRARSRRRRASPAARRRTAGTGTAPAPPPGSLRGRVRRPAPPGPPARSLPPPSGAVRRTTPTDLPFTLSSAARPGCSHGIASRRANVTPGRCRSAASASTTPLRSKKSYCGGFTPCGSSHAAAVRRPHSTTRQPPRLVRQLLAGLRQVHEPEFEQRDAVGRLRGCCRDLSRPGSSVRRMTERSGEIGLSRCDESRLPALAPRASGTVPASGLGGLLAASANT